MANPRGGCFASCVIYADADGKSTQRAFSANGRRVDGITATINALGGSMSTPEETNERYLQPGRY
jgi:hypothetical protein